MAHTYFVNITINHPIEFLVLLMLVLLWALIWKALALWYAARDGRPWWFAALLVINTLGLLEILYIFLVRKNAWCRCKKCGCQTSCSEGVVALEKPKHAHKSKSVETVE